MSSPNEISDLVSQITADVRTIVADEIALVKAEIRPAVRRVGVGSGFFGVAAYFVIMAGTVLWFVFAAGFSWLYVTTTSISGYGAVFFGTLTAVVFLLVVAVSFALFGRNSFRGIRGPQAAPDALGKAVSAVQAGLEEGSARVARELAQPAGPSGEPGHSE
ncbi:MAG: phage holin family protein [Propionibacteriaceae bacterium]|jgi:hypothetical protein|nr:phage holin family protein [Propionibacteriaceae bacterium]